MYARHPPKCEMLVAPSKARGSHKKPCTEVPSTSCKVPMPKGAGIKATNEPYSLAGISQISISTATPLPGGTRKSPGLGGVELGRANSW